MMIFFYGLAKIILSTPIWVWIILIILVNRGIKLKTDGIVSINRSLIIPSIFILWGVEKIIFCFSYPFQSLTLYLLFLTWGAILGYFLHSSTQSFYQLEGVFMRKGNTVQLWVILINFIIKYTLNAAMSVNPDLLRSIAFNSGYSIVSGTTVGLFIGGIINTILKKKGYLKR